MSITSVYKVCGRVNVLICVTKVVPNTSQVFTVLHSVVVV